MTESEARQVLLLRAFESGTLPNAAAPANAAETLPWDADDARWASRSTLEAGGEALAPARFVAERAAHAMRRLAPREPMVARAIGSRLWRPLWLAVAVLIGFVAGAVVDAIGGSQRINLLAPPVWALIAWNLGVYVLLMGHGVHDLLTRRRRLPGAWSRWLHDLLGPARGLRANAPARPDAGSGAGAHRLRVALQTFGANWTRASTPLTAARVSALFHVAAAALAMGLMAGLYVRGLVLDYRAGWESTFLDASRVQALWSVLLSPATLLSGFTLPDVAGFEALRLGPGRAAAAGPAAMWIHLYALMLALLVVVPRTLLALWNLLRARRLAGQFPLALDDPYYQRLLRHQHGHAARVWVLPYAQALSAAAAQAVPGLFKRCLGEQAQVDVAPLLAFGAEDELSPEALCPPGTTLVVALFDLTATPEDENQGRLLKRLVDAGAAGAAAPVVMLLNQTHFVQRFGQQAGRLAQRRQAWQAFAQTLGTHAVWVDLEALDLAGTEALLQTAMAAPVHAVAEPA